VCLLASKRLWFVSTPQKKVTCQKSIPKKVAKKKVRFKVTNLKFHKKQKSKKGNVKKGTVLLAKKSIT